jgi:hypothetical protein
MIGAIVYILKDAGQAEELSIDYSEAIVFLIVLFFVLMVIAGIVGWWQQNAILRKQQKQLKKNRIRSKFNFDNLD